MIRTNEERSRVLLRRVEAFLQASGVRPSRFGRDALNDPNIMVKWRAGSVLRPATQHAVREYLLLQKLRARMVVRAITKRY